MRHRDRRGAAPFSSSTYYAVKELGEGFRGKSMKTGQIEFSFRSYSPRHASRSHQEGMDSDFRRAGVPGRGRLQLIIDNSGLEMGTSRRTRAPTECRGRAGTSTVSLLSPDSVRFWKRTFRSEPVLVRSFQAVLLLLFMIVTTRPYSDPSSASRAW